MRSHDKNRKQLLVVFGYDGARFRGLQPQGPAIPTAGLALKERLTAAAGGLMPKALNFAARTDAGVHALKNLATCWWREALPGERTLADVIAALEAPRDDGLVHVRAFAAPSFVHARGSARGKRYRYLVEDRADDEADPRRPWVWAVAPTLDGERMRAAARHLEGTHDFSSLRAAACDANNAVKTLTSVRVGGPFPVGGGAGARRFVIEVAGDAFLRKMMRNLVGLLVEVGAGLREPDDVAGVLAARSRQAAGLCAPPQGLTLLAVGCAWPEDGSLLLRELGGAGATRAADVAVDVSASE